MHARTRSYITLENFTGLETDLTPAVIGEHILTMQFNNKQQQQQQQTNKQTDDRHGIQSLSTKMTNMDNGTGSLEIVFIS